MGAWGTGAFDNDDAADFLAAYEDGGVGVIAAAFAASKAAAAHGYVEVDMGSATVAAGEIVAASHGKPRSDVTPDVLRTMMVHASDVAASRALVSEAQDAVGRVSSDEDSSELLQLWMESEAIDEWRSGIEDLLARLEAAA